MIGARYWTTGIILRWLEGHGWHASLDFFDDGFADDCPEQGIVSTQGTLRTRYCVADIAVALDVLIADALRFGIRFDSPSGVPMNLYIAGDPGIPPPPDWQVVLAGQARRLGWATTGYDPREDRGRTDDANSRS